MGIIGGIIIQLIHKNVNQETGEPAPVILPRFCRPSTGGSLARKTDLLQGTLDLLILRTLAVGPMHGWAISQRIQQVTGDVLQIAQGSLYPALHRLEEEGWIEAEWGSSEANRQAKFYELTKTGRKQLAAEEENWQRITDAVARVLSQA
jgi:PadR family transcriptional regulator PadR